MKITNMYVHLKGLKIYAYHGVLPQENRIGAEYTIDLQLRTDFTTAAETDNLDNTVNYATIFEAVKAEMSVPSQLLEHVAARIANRLLQNFPLEEVKISIYKQNPPMGADCKQTGIEATFLKD
ncbi:dihydroneopterin aldolase [uncultured Phocaeicola sp.]|jgi:dihydroneopterin aldolase|uniref:dihydroneopterin aldolase n=1 Tax=uncultured Phocaeicola sp. TaxID=990718 RepID=UPI0025DB9E08|nr:dihydroneopterin aldolase [uncultured Phocaeicola sp.]